MSDGPDPRIIALMNQKGGVGKTTTAVNLAAAMARRGKRTLLVDLDPQAHASLHLGIEPGAAERSVYDAILDPGSPPTPVEARENLWIAPAETDLAAAETELAQAPDRQRRLSRALSPILGSFDMVMLDCPPSLGLLTVNGLVLAREVVIPMQAHFLALQGVGKLLETVRLITGSLNPSLKVAGVVLCMYDPQATHTQEVVADLTQFFEQSRGQGLPWSDARVFQPPVRRNIKLAESPSFGQTIFDYAPTAAGAADYLAIADEVLGSAEAGTASKSAPSLEAESKAAAPASEAEPTAGTKVEPGAEAKPEPRPKSKRPKPQAKGDEHSVPNVVITQQPSERVA